ncbi:phage tail protein [Streptomyces sp. NPDC004532]
MAMSIGSLVGYIRLDDSDAHRAINRTHGDLRGLQRDADGRLRDMRGRFASESGLIGRLLGNGIGGGGNRATMSLSGLLKVGGKLGGLLAPLGKYVGLLGAGGPAAAGLAGALVNIAPAAGVAATGVLAVVAANAALKIGLSGVSDAVKEAFTGDDPAKLAEALKKLSPNAREFVLALKGMKPQFDALKTGVQDRLFKGLAQTLKSTAASVLPVLRTNLVSAAGALNNMATGGLMAARYLASNGTLGKALGSATAGLNNLSGIPAIVVNALGQLGAAAGPSFERLTSAAGRAAAGIGDKLSAAFESGALQDAIENAIDLIGELVDVGVNVGKIIGDVFSAAQTSGGNFISTLKTITGAIADAFADPAVQDALGAIFSTVSELAKTAGPLLTQALKAVAPVLSALGPPAQILIHALGDALQPIIAALGPVLAQAAEAVGALVVAFSPLLPVIGDLIAQLLPVLSPLLLGLITIFDGLKPLVQEVADLLGSGALTPVFEALTDVIAELVAVGVEQFLSGIRMVLPLIPQLTPLIVQLATSFGQVLESLIPLLPSLAQIAQIGIQQLLPALLPLIPPLVQLTTLFLRFATGVLTAVVIPALAGLIKFIAGMQTAFQPGITAVSWLVNQVVKLFQWLYDVLVGHSIIPDMVNAIVRWFTGLPGRAVSALSSLGSRITGVASKAMSSLGSSVSRGITTAVKYVSGLPGRAKSALGNIGDRLYGSGRSLISGFVNGILSKIGSVRNAASSIVSAARDYFPFSPAKEGPFSGKGYTSFSGQALIDGFMSGIGDRLPALRAQLGALPGLQLPSMGGAVAALPGGAGGPMYVTLRIGNTTLGQLLIDPLRGAVRSLGGDVQAALGQRGKGQ